MGKFFSLPPSEEQSPKYPSSVTEGGGIDDEEEGVGVAIVDVDVDMDVDVEGTGNAGGSGVDMEEGGDATGVGKEDSSDVAEWAALAGSSEEE